MYDTFIVALRTFPSDARRDFRYTSNCLQSNPIQSNPILSKLPTSKLIRLEDQPPPESQTAHSRNEPTNPLFDTAYSLGRETKLLGLGIGGAVVETVTNPLSKLPELGMSMVAGSVLGALSKAGAPGRLIAAGVGTGMVLKMGYDELTGKRWSMLGSAVADTWQSGTNMDRNVATTRNSLGSFVVDMAVGYGGMKLGAAAVSHFKPSAKFEFKQSTDAAGETVSALPSDAAAVSSNPVLTLSKLSDSVDLVGEVRSQPLLETVTAKIHRIAQAQPWYENVKVGNTLNKCSDYSASLEKALRAENIEAIHVGSEDPSSGMIMHNFLLAKTELGTLHVDPTLSQFVPHFRNVFIGTRNELLAIARASDRSRDWSRQWAEKPVLQPQTNIEPSTIERARFDQTWGSTGVVQYKDYAPKIAEWAANLPDFIDWRAKLRNGRSSEEFIARVALLIEQQK